LDLGLLYFSNCCKKNLS